jgi:hypothetical protein
MAAMVVALAAVAPVDAQAGLVPVRAGCPPRGVNVAGVRVLTLEQAVEAARRIVARGREFIQGRWEKRTRANQQVISASLTAPFRSGGRLYELARRHCGAQAASSAWAIVFHDSVTVLCCETQTVFVVASRSTTYVFGQT